MMVRWFCVLLVAVCAMLPMRLAAQEANPLVAVDLSSPRATMRTFNALVTTLEQAILDLEQSPNATKQADVQRLAQKLFAVLDLSQVPPARRRDAGRNAMAFLVDTLRRIDVPPLESIPGHEAVPDPEKQAGWTIPGTEISITRLLQGAKRGKFVFDAETVERAGEYYDLVKQLPPKHPYKIASWRDRQLQLHGWLFPAGFASTIPESLKRPVFETPIWKVGATALVLFLAGILLAGVHRFTAPSREDHTARSYFRRLLLPSAAVAALAGVAYFASFQVLLVGRLAQIIDFVVTAIIYACVAWSAWLVIFAIIEWVIQSPKIPDQSLDADLLRLSGRVVGVITVSVIAAYGAQELGLPVFAAFAGLGIGGLAIALAAQSSIENLIGGLNLYADRPVRVGDFCRYGGIEGSVEHIGLRSTRIRAIDRTVTFVPNSVLAKVHVTNFGLRDQMLFRHILDLRCETTLEQLRSFAVSSRQYLEAHPNIRQDVTAPRVHVIGFGEWSIKAEVYAYVDTTEFPKFLTIQEELVRAIIEILDKDGVKLALPSQTLYLPDESQVAMDNPMPRPIRVG